VKQFFKRLFGYTDQPRRSITWDEAARVGLVQTPSLSGVTVTEEAALALSAVFRATRVLSESVGTMPLKVYQRTPDGRDEARDYPLWPILHDEPNPEQSAVEFFTLLMWWAVLYGNAFAEVVRDGAGRAVQLWPIPPWTCKPHRTDAGPVYVIRTPDAQDVTIAAEDVLHLKGPTPDGSQGYKLAKLAAESFGYSLALDRFGSALFGNSCKIGGVLKTAGQLSETARDNLKRSWANSYQGVDSTGKIAVLEEGLDFVPFTISNEAQEYTLTRQHQIYEVCRWIGVDPIFVYEYGRATWSNSEAQTRNFLQFSLNPWLKKIETELTRKVFPIGERQTYYPEFVRESVVQMDTKTQHEVWAIGVDKGWYQVEEVRQWLNLPKLPPKPEPIAEPITPQPQEPDGTQKPTDNLPA
jgi:HK97 family phage portal protein